MAQNKKKSREIFWGFVCRGDYGAVSPVSCLNKESKQLWHTRAGCFAQRVRNRQKIKAGSSENYRVPSASDLI
jgi:hypothetical protein